MLNTLSPKDGSNKKRKRIGRGRASFGKTSGKGHKGQNSRAGGGVSPWFEGGQTALKLRSPKRGFRSPNKTVFDLVNVVDLNRFGKDEVVSAVELKAAGLCGGKKPVKILGGGELEHSLTVKANAFSKTAVLKIEDKGGKAETV